MDLILWRHAEAEALAPEAPFSDDNERQLTGKGRKQAAKMGLWLNSLLPQGCRILVSPSVRTRQTALALGRKFIIVDELNTDSNVKKMLNVYNWPHSREPVLIIGHQPHLGDIVSTLIPGMGSSCAIRKANVWWISQKENSQDAAPFLKAVMTPELVLK